MSLNNECTCKRVLVFPKVEEPKRILMFVRIPMASNESGEGGNADLSNYYTKQQTDLLLDKKLSTNELDNAINQALLEAKESGEFKGDKGDKGDRGEQGLQGEKGKDGVDGINGKDGRDGYVAPIVNQSATTATIQPNVLNVWGEVASLDITLATPTDTSIVNEYMIQFTSGAIATQLVLPDTIEWMNEPTINANATYQLSIINNLAVIGEWSNE